MRSPAVLLTPGLWSALSCRPNRLPPWPPCRGEAVAEDSRLGDWAIMGEFGVEVSAPVSVRRCSSLCLCCCSIWHTTTTCCSWCGTGGGERRQWVQDTCDLQLGHVGHWTLNVESCDIIEVPIFVLQTFNTLAWFQNLRVKLKAAFQVFICDNYWSQVSGALEAAEQVKLSLGHPCCTIFTFFNTWMGSLVSWMHHNKYSHQEKIPVLDVIYVHSVWLVPD